MTRDEVLNNAISVTMGDRNETYGDPKIQLQCAAELKAVYAKYAHWDEGLAHREAMDQTLTKISRIACSRGKYHADSYVDCSCYPAIAGEVHPHAD